MAEFKIRVDVELNADDLEAKLKALGKEQEIELKLNTSKIESQLKSLKKSFKDAFKLDSSIMNDLNKIAKALEKVNNANSSEGGTSSSKTATSKLINDYKELYNLTTKLQKQLAKGGLGEDSIERTSKQIDKLKNDMSALYNQMSDAQKQNIDLFNAKQTNKAMVDMNSYLNKIENQATSLQSKLKSVSFDHIDTGKIDLISAKLEEIQTKAREGIDLDFKDIGDILNDLNKLSTVIKDLEKVENLANSFEKISGSIAEAGGDVEKFQNNIKDLENSATKLDGSFDRAFSNANNELKAMRNNIKNVSSGTNGIFGTLDDFKGNFAQFTLAEIAGDFIADGIRTLARGLKDTVVETDSAITDLNKVYEKGLKGDNLKQYLTEFTEVAKQTGKTSVDVIQGTTKAVQSGISDLDQALVFARQSAIFSNVGDVDQEQADTMLAGIMSAYGGVEESLRPVREQVQGMGKDYNTLTKFMDLANYAGELIA